VRPGPRRSHHLGTRWRLAAGTGSLALVAAVLAGCTSSTGTTPAADAVGRAVPLASSTVAATTTWATLAMGRLDDPLNTFWQLLALTGGSWELATPPGVASNGGLMVAARPQSVLAGFGPSQDLRFSPLAHSTDQGSSWDPGVLPAGLARVPDALVEGADDSLALLRSGRGTVVVTTGDLSTWRTVTTTRALTRVPALSGCRVGALTAVTLDPNGNALLGASCARGGQAGVFAPSSTGWMSAGPGIPGVSGGPTEVLRLDQTPAGTAALVSAGTGVATQLFAMWSTNGLRTWTVSPGLPLDGANLLSTGETAAGGFVVATDGGGATPTASVAAPTAVEWEALASPPAGTASVTATPAGGFDALVPAQSTLSVYGLGSLGWGRVQRLHVDVQYGSSG
jgi:hypothetical protein